MPDTLQTFCDPDFAKQFARQRPLRHIDLFDLRLVADTTDAAIATLMAPGRHRVHFVNAHCINTMARDAGYRRALATADMILPDGAGIELAARLCGKAIPENLNGTDFVPNLLRAAAASGHSVFLFGGRPGTAEAAADTLTGLAPGLRIAGTLNGYADATDPEQVIAQVNASGADILLVALGVPMQDTWIAAHADRLVPRICLGVGACFDFLAGTVARAPVALRRARLEWAWRLLQEPRRMAGRYLLGNPIFVARALRHAANGTDRVALLRRLMDLGLSGAALILLGPVLLTIALAIAATSRGPVLFRQTRVGKDGTPFTVFKFRSMHVDAEARRTALLATSDRAGICFKSRNDPRVTRVGRLLRRFSLDELPQILNVLRGDMAIVGPRPALPAEVAAYPARALGRLSIKPGLTGIWQVSGRAEIGFDKMIDMDLAYARSRSLLLDLILIALTFRAVISGRGAY
ncbi:Undecaprenyl-phosphate galactosephosphotransferase [Roseibacterium elongatum DSM 19469]|uniref:Undecaprenyl-phosphate galactosephosphotransferase n=1 Tax=Roseicyclus elongatus DSM 19469 TaxID=1294273 RepID=W8S5F4_9RHOB|nr:WecB/TagA/CpsF family glycosyltransferase [Roseibacterium elongatum]AHM05437.1 Undecaprenyl-phosphate galactosephosphotransferase [Roseibacterium elongatum DSM 19469]